MAVAANDARTGVDFPGGAGRGRVSARAGRGQAARGSGGRGRSLAASAVRSASRRRAGRAAGLARRRRNTPGAVAARSASERDAGLREKRYLRTLERGLAKILSKMGISTFRSYQGAPLFEAIGLSEEIVGEFFPGVGSPIGGIGLEEIALETLARHAADYAAESVPVLEQGGFHHFRRGGEAHAFSPEVVRTLRAAVERGQPLDYEAYAWLVARRDPLALRDLLELAPPAGGAISTEDVEPVEAILSRFTTAAMSIGALSPEAHETLAIAMNRIGARSNSGEGGADPARFWTPSGGDSANDRIKQVASARFGVTAEYLVSADELQIKMAQGSKPGEGGQLPGHKVTAQIARLRRCSEGTTLISPPPHHDIYSIEDLAELIYDLKRVNPRARVSVKLVASAGIGTIATGVAKAFADSILISGHDGGTGASPLGSIKNAGIPWEIGLAEAQQALVASGLRRRVRLQADGGLKTAREVPRHAGDGDRILHRSRARGARDPGTPGLPDAGGSGRLDPPAPGPGAARALQDLHGGPLADRSGPAASGGSPPVPGFEQRSSPDRSGHRRARARAPAPETG